MSCRKGIVGGIGCTSFFGSINHNLLKMEYLKARNIPIHQLAYMGNNPVSEKNILKVTEYNISILY
jgi:dethiobiotin synthetase